MGEYHRHSLKKGGVYIALAWAFSSIVSLCVRGSTPRVSLGVILFALNILGLVFTLPIFLKTGWNDLKTNRLGLLSIRAILGLLGFGSLFLAVTRISLTNAFLLNNCAPLLLPLIIRVWLKTDIDKRLWIGIITGFIGICCILQPNRDILNLGALYGGLSALFFALSMVSVRLLSYTEKHHTILFYFFLIGSLLTLPFAAYFWQPLSFFDFSSLLLIGVAAFLSQLCFIKAFHHAKSSQIGPFNYIGVIYASLLDAIFFHDYPDMLSVFGILLVIAGGIFTVYFTKPPKSLPDDQ